MKLHEKLAKHLESRSLKQADIARVTGIDPAQVSRFLSGERLPGRAQLVAICAVLGTTPESFVEGSEDAARILADSGGAADDITLVSTTLARLVAEHMKLSAEKDALLQVLANERKVANEQLNRALNDERFARERWMNASGQVSLLEIEKASLISSLQTVGRQCQINYEVAMRLRQELDRTKVTAGAAAGIAALAGLAAVTAISEKSSRRRPR